MCLILQICIHSIKPTLTHVCYAVQEPQLKLIEYGEIHRVTATRRPSRTHYISVEDSQVSVFKSAMLAVLRKLPLPRDCLHPCPGWRCWHRCHELGDRSPARTRPCPFANITEVCLLNKLILPRKLLRVHSVRPGSERSVVWRPRVLMLARRGVKVMQARRKIIK